MGNKKIAAFACGEIGTELIEWIVRQGRPVDVIVARRNDPMRDAIGECAAKANIPFYVVKTANSEEALDIINEYNIHTCLLLWWPDIIKQHMIDAVGAGWINLHPALLPYGRGKYPYYWSIVLPEPFGVTLHYIDAEIDYGRVLFQREIPVKMTDTGESLRNQAVEQIKDLFRESYHKIVAGDLHPVRMEERHLNWARDLEPHSTINLDETYLARDLINRIRGRTFLQGDSCHFYDGGKKYRIKVIIEECNA